jgi:hypothetical protein
MRRDKKPSFLDTSYQTMQRDLFESGIIAQIGGNAFTVWNAIKSHADDATGVCWPGVRRLAEMTGNSVGSIHRYIEILERAKLLRATRSGKGKVNEYVARERMDVRLGGRVLCTIVIDFVPDTIRETVQALDKAVNGSKTDPKLFAQCEIIPGEGFTWDAEAGVLRASIPSKEVSGGGGFLPFPQGPGSSRARDS